MPTLLGRRISMAVQTDKKSKRPIIFLGVGVFNTVADFAFYTLLTALVFTEPKQIAMAGLVSGTFALICAFMTHALITWRGSHINYKTLAKFVAFTGFGMWVVRPLLLIVFIKLGGFYTWVHAVSDSLGLPFSYSFVSNTGAFGFMVILVLLYNYFVYSRFVFNVSRTERESR